MTPMVAERSSIGHSASTVSQLRGAHGRNLRLQLRLLRSWPGLLSRPQLIDEAPDSVVNPHRA